MDPIDMPIIHMAIGLLKLGLWRGKGDAMACLWFMELRLLLVAGLPGGVPVAADLSRLA